MPAAPQRRADDSRIDALLRGQAEHDKRLALLEREQANIGDDVKAILAEQRTESEFRHEMIGASKFSRIIQLLIALALGIIALGNALGFRTS